MNIKQLTTKTFKELAIIIPFFFIAILLAKLIETYISPDIITIIFNDNWFIAIPILAILLTIIPLPRYIDYPIAFTLLLAGAGYGVIFVLLSGEAIGGLARNIAEAKYLGRKFTAFRIITSIILITLGGFLMEALL